MGRFCYTAINKQGDEIQGSVDAGTLNDALIVIRRLGLYSLDVAPESQYKGAPRRVWPGSAALIKFWRQGRRLGPQDVFIFTRQLAVLLEAGLPLVRALGTLSRQARLPELRRMIENLAETIQSGKKLSEAMAQYGAVFSPVYINIIKAGETGGALDEVLRQLADFMERNLRFAHRVKSSMMYPLLVLVVAVGILGFVITFVIPRFMVMFEDTGVSLPFLTLLIMQTSAWLRSQWYLFLAGLALVIVLFRLALRRQRFRLAVDRLKLKLPIFGPLLQKIVAARFARTLSTLLSGGVHILPALELTKEVSGNEVVTLTIQTVYDNVREGGTVARVLEQNPVFPQLMTDMVAVGEESGSLEKMLFKVAETFEEEVEIAATTLASLLEPVLIIAMGVIVGFIVLAMFLPLITLIQSLSQ